MSEFSRPARDPYQDHEGEKEAERGKKKRREIGERDRPGGGEEERENLEKYVWSDYKAYSNMV